MIRIVRTDSGNKDFHKLILMLDALLSERDKEAHNICEQYNGIESIKNVILVYDENNFPIGCGAIKEYSKDTMEIKRMFVSKEVRNRGIATKIICELENWAKEFGYSKCILETGIKLPEAMQLYEKSHYDRIPNYGQYECIGGSVCYEKYLTD